MSDTIKNSFGKVQSLQPSFSEAVTLGADVTFDEPRLLYVGVAGDLKVDLYNSPQDATGTVYTAKAAGDFARLVRKIYDSGTTATNLVSEY
jgi:hypothetical protein